MTTTTTTNNTLIASSDIFELASRNKLRFASTKGELNLEQLWDVPLRSRDGFDLDSIAKRANKVIKEAAEESFVETPRGPAQERLEVTLMIVKRVIEVKLAEETSAKIRAANRLEKEKLLSILAEKQAGQLSELSVKELQKRIAALET